MDVTLIFLQGEMVDLYLHQYKSLVTVISSTMHAANFIASILATRLYSWGGWLYVGLGLAACTCLPLFVLPAVNAIQRRAEHLGIVQQYGSLDADSIDSNSLDGSLFEKSSLDNHSEPTSLQTVVFYIPDIALFLNNVMYNILTYDLTDRMITFSGNDMNTAVMFMNLLSIFSLVSALVLAFITDNKLNVFSVMIFGNIVFHAGCIITFGSTTKYTFLHFPFGFELGCLLVGIGDAAVINLSIVSKFVLYEKWGLSIQGLGARSTAVNNLTLNLSVALGIVLSAYTLSRDSESSVLEGGAGVFLLVGVGLIMCRVVT